jgi:hypothetical protein
LLELFEGDLGGWWDIVEIQTMWVVGRTVGGIGELLPFVIKNGAPLGVNAGGFLSNHCDI